MPAQKTPQNDRQRRPMRTAAPDAADAWSLAVVTAALLLCSILVAKTLSFMIEGATMVGPAVVSAEEPMGRRVVSSHRRALSDRFLRRGVDETATGSVLHYNAP